MPNHPIPEPFYADWRNHAECVDDPELFFAPTPAALEAARRICAGCPVNAQCLEDALNGPSTTIGVRAGTVKSQRDALRSQRRKARLTAVNT